MIDDVAPPTRRQWSSGGNLTIRSRLFVALCLCVIVLVCGNALRTASQPGGEGFVVIGFLPLLPVVMSAWLITFMVRLVRRRPFRSMKATVAGGMALMLTCVLLVADVPFKTRFAASEKALNRTANEYLNSGGSVPQKVSPGWFEGRAERVGPGAVLIETNRGWLNCGLLYTTTNTVFPEAIHYEAISVKQRVNTHWWRVCYSW